jgi:predicted metalloprotease with PDZ domain
MGLLLDSPLRSAIGSFAKRSSWKKLNLAFRVDQPTHQTINIDSLLKLQTTRITAKSQATPQSGLLTLLNMLGTGFSFDDGEQVLVSVPKPLGLILEQDDDGPVVVGEVDPAGSAGRSGVRKGDVLVAIQNASVESQSLEYAMEFLAKAPQVVNLRFIRT